MVSTKRTSIFQCNDHRLDELFFYPFWDLQASEKNNFIGRVNLSLTMKTMFLRHSQKSVNSKLKFKGNEWKPSRGFWILLSLQFVSTLAFQKIYQTLIVSHIAISQWKLRKILLTDMIFFFRNAKNWHNYQTITKCGFLIFMQLLNNPNILLTFR